uniref:Uncharacterized protein n=1 Tax=Leptobrachium leishanense TaxID=445787 RepID=A0A8C5WC37_9ANUR
MERIPSAPPPLSPLDRAFFARLADWCLLSCRVDFSHMYQVFKPRKGLKRCEDSKVRLVLWIGATIYVSVYDEQLSIILLCCCFFLM